MGCATESKRQRAVQWMPSPSLTEPFVSKLPLITSFTYIPIHAGRNTLICWEDLLLKKSKSKKLDSAFRSERDQVRDCPSIVHGIKHSPQRLNALQDAAMSDTPKRNAGLIEIGALIFENI